MLFDVTPHASNPLNLTRAFDYVPYTRRREFDVVVKVLAQTLELNFWRVLAGVMCYFFF